MKILIIDQDPRAQSKLKRVLSDDYIVDTAETAEKGEMLTYESKYDAIIIDMVLPDMDGQDLCSMLKARMKNTPILILTNLDSVSDKERAFENGADDYLVKPVNTRELKARLKASIRKSPRLDELGVLKVRDLVMDLDKRLVSYRGERVDLRKKEMQVLEFLMFNKGRVVTRMEVLENVWDMNTNPFTNTVEVHIKRIRDKIDLRFNDSFIYTRHGIGYLFE